MAKATKTTKKLVVKLPTDAKAVAKTTKKKRVVSGKKLTLAPGQLTGTVLDELYQTIEARKGADPSTSHSARLMSRGMPKVAQKFGEESVECIIEAVAGAKSALIGESADVLYHLMVVWAMADVLPSDVWAELERRKGISGIAEKASRAQKLASALGVETSKIP
jgi:phosphoribosyl-ATP pyrophosphohydrolase